MIIAAEKALGRKVIRVDELKTEALRLTSESERKGQMDEKLGREIKEGGSLEHG